jgi:transmembrane protein TMEM260 (protein O-mannosyltransferase)
MSNLSTRVSSPKKTKISLCAGAAATLVAGYADLVRGGTTISALLLAIGYCVMIPLAIWFGAMGSDERPREERPREERSRDRRSRAERANADAAPSYLAALIVSIVIFAIYILTMAPSTAMWDTSEYIAAAYTFGIPHPPGNPFFVIIGRVFAVLPIAPNVAARVNVLAALCSAASAGLWFLITEHVVRDWLPSRATRIAAGAFAALVGATAFTVWNQSVVNEKVYTVSLAGIALVSWLAVRWSANPTGKSADARLVMIAYLCGLGYANHMAGMLPALAVAIVVLAYRASTMFRWKLLLACLAALVAGVSPFATQPIRAAHFPALNEGEPTACRTKIELSCTLSKGTYDTFMYNFNRGQYGKPELADRQASFGDQLGMWWLYFKWQWVRDPNAAHPFTQALFAASFFVLGLIGAFVHFKRDRQSFWYFGPLMFTMTLLLIFYLNFKLGASQNPSSPDPHEVRDRDYFFIWSFSAWSVWVALGMTYVWESVAELVGGWRRAAPVLALGLVPICANWTSASRAHHRATRNVAADLLNSVEPYGVLVTVGDNDTFPLWYAQEVEGVRRDVVIANTSLLGTDWYGRQLIRRPIYDYDEAHGPSIYRGKHWVKPTMPPLRMTFDEVDSVPQYYETRGPIPFSAGPYKTTIDPRGLEYGVLLRADALVLRMIQDSWNSRPIYFARSSGGYARSLGLGDNVLTQGLAEKLFVPPTAQSKDTMMVQGDGWLDVARTRALWDTVFTGQKSIIAEGQWIDRPSVSMPALYLFTGVELADALKTNGDVAESSAVFATTRQVARATGLEGIIRGAEQQIQAPAVGDSAGVTLHIDASSQPKTQSTEPAARGRGPGRGKR